MRNSYNCGGSYDLGGCRPCTCKPNVCAPEFVHPCRPTLLFFYKLAADSGQGLPGAVFELIAPNGTTLLNLSDEHGLVSFNICGCVEYILREVTPPPGYQGQAGQYMVLVDMLGRLFVNGQKIEQLVFFNEPLLAE